MAPASDSVDARVVVMTRAGYVETRAPGGWRHDALSCEPLVDVERSLARVVMAERSRLSVLRRRRLVARVRRWRASVVEFHRKLEERRRRPVRRWLALAAKFHRKFEERCSVRLARPPRVRLVSCESDGGSYALDRRAFELWQEAEVNDVHEDEV